MSKDSKGAEFPHHSKFSAKTGVLAYSTLTSDFKAENQPAHPQQQTANEESKEESKVQSTDTAYAIGSMTKMFTAAAMRRMIEHPDYKEQFGYIDTPLGMLPEKGKSGIETPISVFLPALRTRYPENQFLKEIESQPNFKDITLRNLLQHTHAMWGERSEAGRNADIAAFDEDIYKVPDRKMTLSDIVDADAWGQQHWIGPDKRDPSNRPKYGECNYSWLGYNLAAMIIETVAVNTGKNERSYADVVNHLVIERLELRDHIFTHDRVEEELFKNPEAKMAKGRFLTENSEGKEEWHDSNSHNRLIGEGCMWATAEGLNRFTRAFLTTDMNHSLFEDPETIREMHDPAKNKPPLSGAGYGTGFGIDENGILGHAGGVDGFAGLALYDPATDRSFVVLTAKEDKELHDRVQADLRKTATGKLWSHGSFVGVDDPTRETLIQDEVEKLRQMSKEDRAKARAGEEKGRADLKGGFKSHIDAEKPIRDFLKAKSEGRATDNPFYESIYSQLESTIDKALGEATPEKPALILLGEAHCSGQSLAAEIFALHIANKKGKTHCITETNDPGLDIAKYAVFPDDPTRIPRELVHLPFAAFRFAQEEGIELHHGCDSYYFSEGFNQENKVMGELPAAREVMIARQKEHNARRKAGQQPEEKGDIDTWLIRSFNMDERRKTIMNENVGALMHRLEKPCIGIMMVGQSHLNHLQPFLAQQGHCTPVAVDIIFDYPFPTPLEVPVTYIKDPAKPIILDTMAKEGRAAAESKEPQIQAAPTMLYDALRGAQIGFHILGEITYSSTGVTKSSGAKDLFDKQNPPIAPDADTQFTIGSIQKSFVAATLLKLWDTELTQAKKAISGEQKASDLQKAATPPVKWFPKGMETPVSHFMEALKERFGNTVLGDQGCDKLFKSVEADIRLAENSRDSDGNPTKTITIRDLLNHTHGFGAEDPAKDKMLYRGKQPIELYDLANSFKKGEDKYGTPHYGNVSIALASMIAEIAGSDIARENLTFEDVVDKYVRIPYNLKEHTKLSRDTQDLYTTAGTNASRGIGIDGVIQEELDGNVERYKGGIKSSAQGLVSYARQYMGGTMFENQEVREAVTKRKNALEGHMKDKDGKDTGVTYHLGISANSNIPDRLSLCAGGSCSHTTLTFDTKTKEVNVTLQVLHGFSDHVAKSIFAERYPAQKAALDKLWEKLGKDTPGSTDRLDPEYYGAADKCLREDPQGLEALKLYQLLYDKVHASYTPQQLKTKSEPDDSEHNRNAQTPDELMQEIKAKVVASPDLPAPSVLQQVPNEHAESKEPGNAPIILVMGTSSAGKSTLCEQVVAQDKAKPASERLSWEIDGFDAEKDNFSCPTHIAVAHCDFSKVVEHVDKRNKGGNKVEARDFGAITHYGTMYKAIPGQDADTSIADDDKRVIGALTINDILDASNKYGPNKGKVVSLENDPASQEIAAAIGFPANYPPNIPLKVTTNLPYDKVYNTDPTLPDGESKAMAEERGVPSAISGIAIQLNEWARNAISRSLATSVTLQESKDNTVMVQPILPEQQGQTPSQAVALAASVESGASQEINASLRDVKEGKMDGEAMDAIAATARHGAGGMQNPNKPSLGL